MQKKGFVKQITGNSSFCLVEMGNKQQRKERERERRGGHFNHGQSCHYRSWLMSRILSTRLPIG